MTTTALIPHDLPILPLGDAAVTIEFGHKIDPMINEQALAFAEAVREQRWQGVLDVVPTYGSVTIHVDPLILDIRSLTDRLLEISKTIQAGISRGRLHTIPVMYGGEAGPDLAAVAAFAKLSADDVIRIHASVEYRVYMLGFSPGFPYLGVVPEPIAVPRLPSPRTRVPAGSVGIAGLQTGIYPISTPGGWRLIGRTPLQLYRPDSVTQFLFNPGDRVRFEPISKSDFDRLQGECNDDAH